MAPGIKEILPALKGNLRASIESIKAGRQTKGEILTSLANKAKNASNENVKKFYNNAHGALSVANPSRIKIAAVNMEKRRQQESMSNGTRNALIAGGVGAAVGAGALYMSVKKGREKDLQVLADADAAIKNSKKTIESIKSSGGISSEEIWKLRESTVEQIERVKKELDNLAGLPGGNSEKTKKALDNVVKANNEAIKKSKKTLKRADSLIRKTASVDERPHSFVENNKKALAITATGLGSLALIGAYALKRDGKILSETARLAHSNKAVAARTVEVAKKARITQEAQIATNKKMTEGLNRFRDSARETDNIINSIPD